MKNDGGLEKVNGSRNGKLNLFCRDYLMKSEGKGVVKNLLQGSWYMEDA